LFSIALILVVFGLASAAFPAFLFLQTIPASFRAGIIQRNRIHRSGAEKYVFDAKQAQSWQNRDKFQLDYNGNRPDWALKIPGRFTTF
jgi:hypothetical protein